MILSYKARQFLRRFALLLLVLALLTAIALLVGSVWLRRFVVYTPDGVRLDFQQVTPPEGVEAVRPSGVTVPIVYPDADQTTPEQQEQQPLVGYYITAEQMRTDLEGLRQQIAQLPAGTAIMLDVKNFWGYFFYTTALGPGSDSFILAQIDSFIAELTRSELYVIARLPAFRDYEYGLNNIPSGLATAKGYLWTDEKGCYWLDPTDDGTLTYLIQITKELRTLGFDEVVFQDFYVPESNKIAFDADRKEAVEAAAATLVTSCATDAFAVSFVAYRPDLVLPEGNCRLYLTGVAAAEVADVLAQTVVENRLLSVVFLAETNDTRYDVCGTLRPLELAH